MKMGGKYNQTVYDSNMIRAGYDVTIRSSSLKPGTPTVTSASLKGDVCKIKVKFPVNVDVKDTYTYFVSHKYFKNNNIAYVKKNNIKLIVLNYFM